MLSLHSTLDVKCKTFINKKNLEKKNVSSDCCIVFLHKGAIAEVILVYDLNVREFSMEMPNSLGQFAWGCQIL